MRGVDVSTVSNVKQMREATDGERGSLILSSVRSVEQNILERVDEMVSQGEENT